MWDEGVPFLLTEELLQVVEEGEALLVWDAGECIVGIFTFQVWDQLGELVVFAKLGNAVTERFPADDGAEVAVFFAAVDRSLQSALEICRPAFVQPEVLPAGVRHEVTGPGMGELVGDYVDILSVAAYDGGCGECVNWVLHSDCMERTWSAGS